MNPRGRRAVVVVALAGFSIPLTPTPESSASAQVQAGAERSFSVVASRYTFVPLRLEVVQDDLVRVELRTSDIAHSFTIDDYRVAKRVGPGQTVTFEFRAERAGTFPFYCDLKTEEGCREMRGQLIVKPRP